MKLSSYICLCTMILCIPFSANAGYSDSGFRTEVLQGLDIISAHSNPNVGPDAPGELGRDVYFTTDAMADSDIKLFIPTSMYLRAGGGLNLGFATDKARIGDNEYESSGSYTTQIGLGWNLSSFIRTELDLQGSVFSFHNIDDVQATYYTGGAMLYFDLLRRYVSSGDVIRRRHFVPFIGVGAAAGTYKFQGASGADGSVIAAPRAAFGFNIMLNDLIGIDLMYQYQMMLEQGFGWNTSSRSSNNVSNIMASVRVNF